MQAFAKLIEIAKLLRSDRGCPWDRKQTIATMLPHLQSEVTEIATAIRKKDWENLEEELGDVLFNLIMITQIGAESKQLQMNRLLKNVAKKIKSRHSWVFGKDRAKVKTAADAYAFWQANKAMEKLSKGKKNDER